MRTAASFLLLLAAGCAAPSFIGQTGRVTPKGDVRLGAGIGYQANTSAASVVRDGRDLARGLQETRRQCPDLSFNCWSIEDVRPVLRSGMKFALVAPLSVNTQLSARYGFAPGLDVGLRFGPGNKGIDAGWQVSGPREAASEGWAQTLFAGWGKRDLGTLGSVIEDVLQGDASLDDFSLTWVTGRQFREIGHFYVGARYIYTHWKVQVIPDVPIVYDGADAQRRLLGTDASGHVQHLGGVVGGALGYKKVFVGAELDLLQTFGKADVLFEEVSFNGFGVMPAVYLYGQF